jgi:diguanylate cyclase (GGDEF)-like protein
MRNLLKDVGILADLCEAELRQVASFFDFHGYAKDEVLFQEGASGEELYIVGLGRVASWIRLADGGAHKVSEFGAGDFFGEMAIIERAPRSATCQALEPSAVFVLKAADFYRLLDEQPEIAIKIMNRMLDAAADRSIRTSEFLSDMVRWGDEARKRAVLDGLTGLFNRRFVEEALRDGLQKARAGGAALSLVMMDLDHVRQINQHYGADTGDQAIRALVPVLRSVLRAEDVPARLGGDEFAILLPDTPLQEAMRLAQAICAGVRELPFFEGRGGPLRRITTSQGIACFPEHGAEVKGLWEAADRALYRAKEQGRDQAALPPGK